ncbi:MAG: hypothetical protein ACRD5E_11575 [Nitrososphaeraceae archaeon]
MTSLTCKFILFFIVTIAAVAILTSSIYDQILKAQNMTANDTRNNNTKTNDSGAQVPVRPPFAVESN